MLSSTHMEKISMQLTKMENRVQLNKGKICSILEKESYGIIRSKWDVFGKLRYSEIFWMPQLSKNEGISDLVKHRLHQSIGTILSDTRRLLTIKEIAIPVEKLHIEKTGWHSNG